MSYTETRELISAIKELIELLKTVDAKTEKLSADMPQSKQALLTKRDLFRLVSELTLMISSLGSQDLNDYIRRVHIYPTGWPEYNSSWLSIVEGEGGTIKVIWHGKFVGEVRTVYQLKDDGTLPIESSVANEKSSELGEKC